MNLKRTISFHPKLAAVLDIFFSLALIVVDHENYDTLAFAGVVFFQNRVVGGSHHMYVLSTIYQSRQTFGSARYF